MNELVPENSSVLKAVSTPWDFSNPAEDATSLVDRMMTLMREEGGMGLAANQVGLEHRLFVMEYQGTTWA